MEFEHLNIEVDRYTVRKLISPEIEIAEINDNGYNGYDFVLIKYVNKKNVCEQVQLLALKYKQSEKTLCLIGCEKEDIVSHNFHLLQSPQGFLRNSYLR